MAIKLIKSEEDYDKAISLLEAIGDNPNFENDKNLIDEFELLEKLIGDYEKENFPIEKGDPIEIIKLKMIYMDLKQKDLIPYIGSKGIVSEVLNKKRQLSKNMIRELSKFLGINQDILNTEYKLQKDNANISKKEVTPKSFKFLRPRGVNSLEIQRIVTKRGTIVQLCA